MKITVIFYEWARIFSFLFGMSVAFFCYAEEKENDNNPIGCADTGYRYRLKTLELVPEKKEGSNLYVFHNLSSKKVSLFQMRHKESSRSMYFNHAILEKQWAVFSTTEDEVRFICSIPDKSSTYGKIVDCSQYLRICQYVHVKYGLNNQGNYWLLNTSSKNSTVRNIVYYGIIPGA